MRRPKLAVIGASHFQLPLIHCAQRMGCEVHAFAWQCGDVGERQADVFHPISIVETQAIVDECRRLDIDGVCTIASDLATVAVCHVADALGLPGNSLDCMRVSTDKHLMREAFAAGGDPSPRSIALDERSAAELQSFDPTAHGIAYPLIVKPADRSGSRGVTRLDGPHDPSALAHAVRFALDQSLCKQALIEEFAPGDEFSVEGMSWQGTHRILAITRKHTTGAPHFIETAHLQPAGLEPELAARIESVALHALDTLGVELGASHTELKVAPDGTIRLIEIGARMGGDCIGSHLVELSSGIDYVRAVVNAALGNMPDLTAAHAPAAAASRFLFDAPDLQVLEELRRSRPDLLRYELMTADPGSAEVTDSSTRLGHFVISAPTTAELAPFLPDELARIAREAMA